MSIKQRFREIAPGPVSYEAYVSLSPVTLEDGERVTSAALLMRRPLPGGAWFRKSWAYRRPTAEEELDYCRDAAIK